MKENKGSKIIVNKAQQKIPTTRNVTRNKIYTQPSWKHLPQNTETNTISHITITRIPTKANILNGNRNSHKHLKLHTEIHQKHEDHNNYSQEKKLKNIQLRTYQNRQQRTGDPRNTKHEILTYLRKCLMKVAQKDLLLVRMSLESLTKIRESFPENVGTLNVRSPSRCLNVSPKTTLPVREVETPDVSKTPEVE